ncbi:MAG: hypothetical protein CM1200mP29_04640 [Verrucomicrobiota bacterium]|nr:MAG: hypothetical protein CM1200mP29_04640 [Verrucomicrobiota bacterium]
MGQATTCRGANFKSRGGGLACDVSTPRAGHAYGLRALGPAHYGPGTYAPGTNERGGLGQAGPDLLQEMERLGIILDVTHLSDESFDESMDIFGGTVWASHCNCRALVPGDRQLSDPGTQAGDRARGVIGAALDAWMLIPDWERGVTTPRRPASRSPRG